MMVMNRGQVGDKGMSRKYRQYKACGQNFGANVINFYNFIAYNGVKTF
jgi:hypothetical protein